MLGSAAARALVILPEAVGCATTSGKRTGPFRFYLFCKAKAKSGKEAYRLTCLFGPFVAKTKGLGLSGHERHQAFK